MAGLVRPPPDVCRFLASYSDTESSSDGSPRRIKVKPSWKHLPNEIWLAVFEYLSPEDLVRRVLLVCKRFYQIASSDPIWLKHFERRFGCDVLTRTMLNERAKTRREGLSFIKEVPWKDEFVWRSDPQTRVPFFNAHPIMALHHMQRDGLLQSDRDVGRFLATPNLSKRNIGFILGRLEDHKGEWSFFENAAELRLHFARTFDWTGVGFLDALRTYLQAIHLPSSAVSVDRIISSFAKRYYESTGGDQGQFIDGDRVYVLAFSTIMLNTDMYSSAIKKYLLPSMLVV
eukprot:TRINITY_DN5644_c0_g1_i2.p1 TRINITY_DN5644_c0_g1~~TRINITY_DN5644_c0_g1_i2.p1  ORF type:complete len:287 (-),score=90.70 TRINITY_DN5644_c0_g1_i2:900-1760(-)